MAVSPTGCVAGASSDRIAGSQSRTRSWETAVLSPLRVAGTLEMTPGAWMLIVPSGPRCSGCILLIEMYTFTGLIIVHNV